MESTFDFVRAESNGSSAPTISVLLHAYNADKTIEGFIQTIQAQILTRWELIVVDDASQDDSFRLATKYDDGSKIRVVRCPVTRGQWSAYSLAAEYATGNYLLFARTDERWYPHALRACYDLMEQSGAAIGIAKNRLAHPMGAVLKPGEFYRLQLMAPPPVADEDRVFVCRKSVWNVSGGYREGSQIPKVEFALRVAVAHDVVVLPEGLLWVDGGVPVARTDRLWRNWIDNGRQTLVALIGRPEAPLSNAVRQALLAGLTGAAVRQCLQQLARGHILTGIRLWQRNELKICDLPQRKCYSPWIPPVERHKVYHANGV